MVEIIEMKCRNRSCKNKEMEVYGPYVQRRRDVREIPYGERYYTILCPICGNEFSLSVAKYRKMQEEKKKKRFEKELKETTAGLPPREKLKKRYELIEKYYGKEKAEKFKREKLEKRALTDELCPVCKKAFLYAKYKDDGTVRHYYCSDPDCPAHLRVIKSHELKEKRERIIKRYKRERAPFWRPISRWKKRREVFGPSRRGRRKIYREEKRPLKESYLETKRAYRDEKREVKEAYKRGEMSRAEYYKRKTSILNRFRKEKEGYKERVHKAKKRRLGKPTRKVQEFIENRWGKDVMKAFIVILFAALGFAISGAFGSILFLFGFLSLALYYIFPSPDEETPPRELARQLKENPLTWRMVGSRAFLRNPHTVWGFLKTIFKLSTFILFIFGVWYSPMVPFKNIVLIILCFGAYFSLKMTYNTHMPHQFIESVIRFGLLGAFFIPWVIFYGIFQSGLLALLAMAFFMIPPIAEDKQNTETFAMYEMFDKFIFFGFMLVALIASGVLPLPWIGDVGWKLTGTLQWTFLYFWVVSFVAGFFSPAQTRPAMGFIMLGAATIIYGIGPGAQEFGTALLGPWYPVIQNLFSSIAKPFAEVFGQFANTFGSALMLLVNPVGYAQSIMNGTYVRDSTTGLQGAYGIEIERFEVMPIYTESPYVVSVMVKNKGAFEARNVRVILVPSANVPREEKSWVWGVKEAVLIIPRTTVAAGGWNPLSIEVHMPFLRPNITMTEEGLGFVEEPDTDRGITQNCKDDKRCVFAIDNMTKLQTSQANFYSDGIMCPAVVNYGLMTKEKAKVLPFIGMIQYDYNISSNLEVEAMSKEEWNRKVEEMELQPRFKKLTTFTNAPVMLNVDTLEQPILEGSPFHIALNIVSAHRKGRVVGNATVRLEIPTNFTRGKGEENLPPCVPDKIKPKIIKQDDTTTLLEWKGLSEPYAIFCSFPPIKVPEGPTITYMVRADASYTFTKWDTLDTRMQFGGTACCKEEEDCPIPRQICDTSTNKCGAGAAATLEERLNAIEQQLDEIDTRIKSVEEKTVEDWKQIITMLQNLKTSVQSDWDSASEEEKSRSQEAYNALIETIDNAINTSKEACKELNNDADCV